jgi:hypothetical protein
MVGLGDEQDRLMWQRWRAGANATSAAPDALQLAAYAEGRLDETDAEAVENFLAAYPDALNEIVAARAAIETPAIGASDDIIAKACALVPMRETVVPLRRPAVRWHNALAWGSIAASLVAASFVGFTAGSDAYRTLAPTQANESLSGDSLESSAGLEVYFADDSGT